MAPFFRPDGQWVAFFANGKLKKVAIVDGAPVPVCDAIRSSRRERDRFTGGLAVVSDFLVYRSGLRDDLVSEHRIARAVDGRPVRTSTEDAIRQFQKRWRPKRGCRFAPRTAMGQRRTNSECDTLTRRGASDVHGQLYGSVRPWALG